MRSTYQLIILIDDRLNINRKMKIAKELRYFIEHYTKKINIKYEETKNLAYKIEEHEKAWFIAMQIKLKSIGANKRIREIKERLNTYEEIIKFDIIEKGIEKEQEDEENKIYLVYEFDYGDVSNGSEPSVTHFDCYKTREKAIEKAKELLQEGLENYYIEADLANLENPFKNNNTVELFNQKNEDEQDACIYSINIKKLNLI